MLPGDLLERLAYPGLIGLVVGDLIEQPVPESAMDQGRDPPVRLTLRFALVHRSPSVS